MFTIVTEINGFAHEFYLPAIPKVGEQIYIDSVKLEVKNVVYTKNLPIIFADVTVVETSNAS